MNRQKIVIFDTTLREGELSPGVSLSIRQKIDLAQQLEAMQVDVVEVGYPGAAHTDFDAIYRVAEHLKQTTICGLAGSQSDEIVAVALALKPATRSRIHLFTPIHRAAVAVEAEAETLDRIREHVALARHYSPDVEWTAFNALLADSDFLCRAVETAIANGATTISIPDTLGTATTAEFVAVIRDLRDRVPNSDRAIFSVHCHNDRGLAVANSLAALDVGVRQIECTLNGIGARKGNADLEQVVEAIAQSAKFYTDCIPPPQFQLIEHSVPGLTNPRIPLT
ncbi:MAG: hypothetical protein WCD18_21785 [Thermosynechococcaceae cyanobacterium]